MAQCVYCLAWLLMASATFWLGNGIALGLPAWQLGLAEFYPLSFSWGAFLCSAAMPLILAFTGQRAPWPLMALTCVLAFAGLWYAVQFVGLEWPVRYAVSAGGVAILIIVGFSPAGENRFRKLVLLASLSALMAVVSLPATQSPWIYRGLEAPFSYLVDTSLHRVQIKLFREHLPRPSLLGGGLAVAGEKVLLVTGDGLFYLLDVSPDGKRLDIQALNITTPMNAAEFRALPHEFRGKDRFHAIGILVVEGALPGGMEILVSHHYWYAEKSCYVVRVSSLATSLQNLQAGHDPANWQTVFETTPCMPLDRNNRPVFAGHQSGGRLIRIDPQHVLLSLGDHDLDGLHSDLMVSQEMAMSFGKTIEINTVTGESRVFTSGHRNPQGLHRDRQGRIWLTEHGPKGGDELNLVRDGNNYGWPLTTLGAAYGEFSWPVAERRQPQQKFVDPSFAWIPSIAVSNLTSVDGGDFERWQGDLIVASLKARSLYRVHLENGEPILAEPMLFHERVRDIVRDSQGRIMFWTDRAAIGLLEKAAEAE